MFLLLFYAILVTIAYFFDKKEAEYWILEQIKNQERSISAYKKLYEKVSTDLMHERDKVKDLEGELFLKNEIVEDFPTRDPKTGKFVKRDK